jgi:hypothetical protein
LLLRLGRGAFQPLHLRGRPPRGASPRPPGAPPARRLALSGSTRTRTPSNPAPLAITTSASLNCGHVLGVALKAWGSVPRATGKSTFKVDRVTT